MPPLFATRADLESTWSAARVAALVAAKGGDADTAITAALVSASETAVGYLRSRYPTIALLPAVDAPAPLKSAVAKLAMHGLGLAVDHLADDVNLERDRAISFLRDVGKGAADLGLPGAPAEDRGASGSVFTDAGSEPTAFGLVVDGWLR